MISLSAKQLFHPALIMGLVGVALVAILFTRGLQVNASTAGFCFLLVVLGVAATAGFAVSAVVSLAAMLCFNFYFLPPVGRFTIADPEDWVALLTFLATALVASHLSDRARRRADEARARQMETEQLYALSRAILLTDVSQSIGTQAAQAIAQVFACPAVALLDAKSRLRFHGGPGEIPTAEQHMLEDAVRSGTQLHDSKHGMDVWAISLGGTPVGALAAVGLHASDGAVQSILNLVAIALERVRTEEAANRAEIARQSEEIKSILLDSIAHDFKTPLTSLKAAATGLALARDEDRLELTAVIEEEVDRLSTLVTEATKMAEIDAGKVRMQATPVSAEELLESVRAGFRGRGSERIHTQTVEGTLVVDRDLLGLAVRQVLDNALKYSGPDSVVVFRTVTLADAVELRIEDDGPGIPARERERIFEKFYRRSNARDGVPGSGMGLHIAREIARMHGGDLLVEAREPRGSVFCFRLPDKGQA